MMRTAAKHRLFVLLTDGVIVDGDVWVRYVAPLGVR
jgi:hypothetical protein